MKGHIVIVDWDDRTWSEVVASSLHKPRNPNHPIRVVAIVLCTLAALAIVTVL